MAAALLSACGASGPKLTALPFTDDFNDAKSGWTVTADLSGDTKYDNGRLHILVKNENFTIWSTAGKLIKDGVYEVDAQPIGGPQDNGFGVIYRMKDRKNFQHFEISSDGYWRAGQTKDGTWANWSDWIQHPAIKTGGDVNRIKIMMKADKVTFFVNDQMVNERAEPAPAAGDIGVFALTLLDQPGVEVVFDNVSVSEAK